MWCRSGCNALVRGPDRGRQSQLQHSQRLHHPFAEFGMLVRRPANAACAAQIGIEGVGLAAATPVRAVGPVDLHHLNSESLSASRGRA